MREFPFDAFLQAAKKAFEEMKESSELPAILAAVDAKKGDFDLLLDGGLDSVGILEFAFTVALHLKVKPTTGFAGNTLQGLFKATLNANS